MIWTTNKSRKFICNGSVDQDMGASLHISIKYKWLITTNTQVVNLEKMPVNLKKHLRIYKVHISIIHIMIFK